MDLQITILPSSKYTLETKTTTHFLIFQLDEGKKQKDLSFFHDGRHKGKCYRRQLTLIKSMEVSIFSQSVISTIRLKDSSNCQRFATKNVFMDL